MFTVSGKPILADELAILQELKTELALNGVQRFGKFRKITNHIQFCCPFHNNGQEKRPSCGITTVDIHQNNKLVKAGTVHCFSCGHTCNLEEMISYVFGYEDSGKFGASWLRKNFVTIEYEERPDIDIDLDRGKKVSKQETKYIDEDELDSYRFTHPYAYKRKLTDDIIEQFDVGYDDNFLLTDKNGKDHILRCLTFPVRDETGSTLFIARRSVDTKFFHYPEGVVKPVYGLYELSLIKPYPNDIIICESIINCLTCWSYGKYAVALNGTGTPFQYEQLKRLPARHFILALDPDRAGENGREKLRKALGKSKLLTEYILPKGKDINDLTKDEFDNLKEFL